MSRRDDYEIDEADVPEMDEHPYYVARLERRIRNGRYGGKEWLSKLKLSTLKLLDEHKVDSDLDMNTLKKYAETDLRNILFMGSKKGNQGISLTQLESACKVMQLHHKLKSDDFTKLPAMHIDMVAEAVQFLAVSRLMEFAPPRLTHYVMRNPGSAEIISDYIKERGLNREAVHNIDLDSVDDFVNNPSHVLREGVL